MQNYLQQTEKEEVKYWLEHNLKNHLKTNQENVGEIEHIIDYLNSSSAPKRLRKMSYEEANKAAAKWLETQKKLGMDIIETPEDTELCIDFQDGTRLVRLIGENAYKREGFLMSHCVASYYGKDNTEVLSLRDKNNMPHCTIERTDGILNQVKGKGNGSIHPNYINYIVKSLEYLKVNVRESELQNLGYIALPDGYKEFALTVYDKISTSIINGKEYLYILAKPKLR